MKKRIAILLVYFITAALYSQLPRMQIDGKPRLLNESFPERRDINGRLCAVIRVIADKEGFAYDAYNGIVGNIIDRPGKDQIYLSPDERILIIFKSGYEPLKIILSEIDIQLRENQIWEIQIKGGAASILPVSFVVSPVDVNILINGRAMGSGPTFQLDQGEYKIRLEKEGYLDLCDTVLMNENKILFTYQLVIKPKMIFVQGGTFDMGDKYGDSNEKPVHRVTLNSFGIGKTEVTQSQWISVLSNNPSEFRGDSLPVEKVSWYDAVAFCNVLSKLSGHKPCYTIDKIRKDTNNSNESNDLKWLVTCDFSKNGYRLPSEAEWEYSARGGEKSKGYKYSGNNNVNDVAWYTDNAEGKTHPVGQKKSNELGVYDMSGNVWEWCWDWYGSDYYSDSPRDNPHGPVNGSYHVWRGGSYNYDERDVRSANRGNYTYVDYRFNNIGFRLCRTFKK